MLAPMRNVFRKAGVPLASVDFTDATVLQLATPPGGVVESGRVVSFYKATIAPGSSCVYVDWGDWGTDDASGDFARAEVVYPGADGSISLSHIYVNFRVTADPVVRISNDLSELRFSGVTIASVGKYNVTVNEFFGAQLLKGIVNIGSKIRKVLTPGLFSNTRISEIPAGYSLPSLTSRVSAPHIPLACFMKSSITSTDNLPAGAVAIDALAFERCYYLSSLAGLSTSPGIKHIGYAAFRSCMDLTSLAGLSCTLAYDSYVRLFGSWTDMDAVLEELHPGATQGYRVDQFLFGLGAEAFKHCTTLTDISDLHVSGGLLLRGTFSECYGLSSIPQELLAIGVGFDTSQATSYSSTAEEPGGYRFHLLPRYVKSTDVYQDYIGNYGRYAYERWTSGGIFNATGITSLPYAGSITSMPYSSGKLILYKEFSNCEVLNNVTIPSSVKRIARDAFSGCIRLKAITFEGRTMQAVRGIGEPSTGWTYINEKAKAFPFGLPSGCVITCTDGTITV